jgi:XTP/dITP diphosphohydrolase
MTDNTDINITKKGEKQEEKSLSLFIGTSNLGKIAEYTKLLKDLNVNLVDISPKGLLSLGLTGIDAPVEDGKTFYENAYIKARYYADITKIPCIADDSGLMIEALNGAPGVMSNRYGLPEGTPEHKYTSKERNNYLLEQMKNIKDRKAVMMVTCVLAKPFKTEVLSWEGKLMGEITLTPKGDWGFGFDPIFLVPEYGITLAKMTFDEKNQVSHRAKVAKLIQNDVEKIREFLSTK